MGKRELRGDIRDEFKAELWGFVWIPLRLSRQPYGLVLVVTMKRKGEDGRILRCEVIN